MAKHGSQVGARTSVVVCDSSAVLRTRYAEALPSYDVVTTSGASVLRQLDADGVSLLIIGGDAWLSQTEGWAVEAHKRGASVILFVPEAVRREQTRAISTLARTGVVEFVERGSSPQADAEAAFARLRSIADSLAAKAARRAARRRARGGTTSSVGDEAMPALLVERATARAASPRPAANENARRSRSRAPSATPTREARTTPSERPPGGEGYRRAAVAIGSSTGGPDVLERILRMMPRSMPPVLIVQHIQNGFSGQLADRLNAASALRVMEAMDGDIIEGGCAYVAPAGSHLSVERRGLHVYAKLLNTPPVNGHKPSADVLMHSVAQVWRGQALGVILTGMGNDGAQGLLAMRREGAETAVQSEASCAVFGMPKQALAVGAATLSFGVEDMGRFIATQAAALRSTGS